ncbi:MULTISPECIES: hypothetical protein [Anaeromyxobacter]|uniref:hypothetical protein n=1 Tax=Anaeromyxobacter TaxID=161492 RepID=UPI001F5A0004|nr:MULTISPECIES: hypothetical protein [unclassified Anaeromyxobacter]
MAIASLLLAGSAAAHDLTCELGVGLAAPLHGKPAIGMDGRPLMIAPAATVLDVDAYPALLVFRVAVTNVADAPSVVTGLDGDPAVRAGPSSWTFGSRLLAGLTLPVGRSAEELVVVPVASRAACVALGGEPGGDATCRTETSAGARVLVRFDRGQTECRARFRCGPDAPALPSWSGARQLGWEGQDTAHGIALDREGELHLIGHSFDLLLAPWPGLFESFVATVTRDGSVLPVRPWSAPGTNIVAAAAGGAGSVTYAGWDLDGTSGAFVRKVARDGTVVWERSPGVVYSLVTGGPGGIVIAASLDWQGDALVTKYGAGGEVVWEVALATPLEDRPVALTVDAAGNTYVAGQATDPAVPTTSDVFLAKLDASGGVEWMRTLATSDLDVPTGVGVGADGVAAVAGHGVGSTGTTRPWVAAFDPAGAPRWTWTPAPAQGITLVSAVAADPAAGFWVGASGPSGTIMIVRLSAGGSELWTRSHGPFGSVVSAIAIDGAGDAYVAGSTSGDVAAPNAGSLDAFVIRLRPDGRP